MESDVGSAKMPYNGDENVIAIGLVDGVYSTIGNEQMNLLSNDFKLLRLKVTRHIPIMRVSSLGG